MSLRGYGLTLAVAVTLLGVSIYGKSTGALEGDAFGWRSGSRSASRHESNWAVLVSTSRFWLNYRHIVNTMSIYHVIKRLGIPDCNIILMIPGGPDGVPYTPVGLQVILLVLRARPPPPIPKQHSALTHTLGTCLFELSPRAAIIYSENTAGALSRRQHLSFYSEYSYTAFEGYQADTHVPEL